MEIWFQSAGELLLMLRLLGLLVVDIVLAVPKQTKVIDYYLLL
jgi:hypothetical protein